LGDDTGMERKMYTVKGTLSLPLEFMVKADSQQAANEYAETIFNDESIAKMEADLYDKRDKVHYLLADSCKFSWFK
jgi:hypothetical protein